MRDEDEFAREALTRSDVLPAGWCSVALPAMAHLSFGQSPPSSTYHDSVAGLPFFQGKTEFGTRYPTVKQWCTEPTRIAEKGDILLSIRAPVGPTNVAPFRCGIGRGLASIRPAEGVLADFLLYFLRHIEQELSSMGTGTTFGAITKPVVSALQIPLAPTTYQARLVQKLDELFSAIDEGERALERVRKLVERYRQSVLNAAVMGDLTRDWREQHEAEHESGEVLLRRILEARRTAWEMSESHKMKTKGIRPANASWKKNYKEPVSTVVDRLPPVPDGWTWASLDQVCGFITSGSRGWKEHYATSGSKFIRAQNIKHDVLDLNDVAFVDLSKVTEGLRTRVSKDDLLVTITGANVTKSALVELEVEDAYVSQHVALLRPVFASLSGFAFLWIVSPANGRKQLAAAAYGAGKPGLSLEDIRSIAIALPPEEEQRVICDRVALEMSRLSHIEDKAANQTRATANLRSAILRAAFSGQLVPQDATDEPASVLLERIAADRAEQSSIKRAVKPKSTPKPTRRRKAKV